MTIEFNCPDCNKLLRTSDERAGQTANCPTCGSVVFVPHVELYDVDISSDDIYGDDIDNIYDDADDDQQAENDHVIPSTTNKGDFDSVFSPDATGSTRSQQEFDEFDELDEDVFRGEKTCPMCGVSNSPTAKQCSRCGENLFHQQFYQQSKPEFDGEAPHRGGLILGLGIASFFTCCIFLGIASWIMGSEDIREIDAGRMDPTGRDFTQAGRILGMISVIFQASIVLFFCCFMGIVGA